MPEEKAGFIVAIRNTHRVVGQLGDPGPRGLGGRGENAEDAEELINLRITREHCAARNIRKQQLRLRFRSISIIIIVE
jgi:hypothetical protein